MDQCFLQATRNLNGLFQNTQSIFLKAYLMLCTWLIQQWRTFFLYHFLVIALIVSASKGLKGILKMLPCHLLILGFKMSKHSHKSSSARAMRNLPIHLTMGIQNNWWAYITFAKWLSYLSCSIDPSTNKVLKNMHTSYDSNVIFYSFIWLRKFTKLDNCLGCV